jgi:hydroxyacylglutathione hydrolase
MFLKVFVDEGLGNCSYLIASTETGLAAVIDPQRDVDRYFQVADGLGLKITYSLDTHLHSDFVTGAREMASKTAGKIRIGASARAALDFDHMPLDEGYVLLLGGISMSVMATPGHTPEHISFIASPGGSDESRSVFSGGALIVGGAARTDLLGHESSEPLARRLYNTIHHRLLGLSDDVRVYPTHGAGSFCAAPASRERTTTIGSERLTNRLAQAGSEDEFVRMALTGLPSYPSYYRYLRELNRKGPRVLGGVPPPPSLSPQDAQRLMENGAVIVDIRRPREFAAGHIRDSYGIPLASPLVTWAGWVVPFGSQIILVADDAAKREEAVRQLIRIGYDDLQGYLDGGIEAWEAAGLPVAGTPMIDVNELHARLQRGDAPHVIDVRFESEWKEGHLPGAEHIEAGRLAEPENTGVPRDRPVVIHCSAANRATVALSLLERRGYRNLTVLDTGFGKWRDSGYEVDKAAA